MKIVDGHMYEYCSIKYCWVCFNHRTKGMYTSSSHITTMPPNLLVLRKAVKETAQEVLDKYNTGYKFEWVEK